MIAQRLPKPDDISSAVERLKGQAVRTPLLEFPVLNARTGGRVLIKPENLQRIGAFKFRGAFNAVSRLDRERWPGGVVACSSGNHAQGVAEAARILGLDAAIVMPNDAPRLKLEGTRAAGAEVLTCDRVKSDRYAIAAELAEERRAAFVPPYDDLHIIAGQGTIGHEILEDAEDLGAEIDMVVAPCGGGGLISGIALWLKHACPTADIYAVEPAGFDDLARSLASGHRERNLSPVGSICDSLLAATPGELTFEINRNALAGALAVADNEVQAAMRFAFESMKLVVEPGGATALAALLSGRLPVADRTVAIVLSGGNVDPVQFAEILGRRTLS